MVFSNTSLSSPHLTFRLSLLPSEQRAEHVPYMVKKELYRMRRQKINKIRSSEKLLDLENLSLGRLVSHGFSTVSG